MGFFFILNTRKEQYKTQNKHC